jgi:probable phosphoglycerate mutase
MRALDTAHPGADLTELGERQVRELGELLADERIDAVHASPRLRARRTAAALAEPRRLEPVVEDGLVEVAAGEWEMATDEHLAEAYNGVVTAWVRGDLDASVPGGESGHEAVTRVDEAVTRILATGHERVAVVAHGAVLRGWCGVRVAGASDLAATQPLRNTGLVRVSGEKLGELVVTHWDEQVVPSGGEAGAAVEL